MIRRVPQTVILGPDLSAFRRWLDDARHAPATILFLAACVVVFAIAEHHGSTEDVETLIRFGATERGHVWAGQLWRLLTSVFLHIGFAHLAWNVFAMLGWCIPVERALGSRRFATMYLASAVAGSATSLAVWDVIGAGASGAGFGVIGATLMLTARRLGSLRAFFADRGVRRTLATALVWTLALLSAHVDHAAHLGGFVAGVALTWAITVPAGARPESRALARSAAAIAVALPVVVALVPRPGATRYRAFELETELAKSLQRDDLDSAEQVLARIDEADHTSTFVEYTRAYVQERRGHFDAAANGFDALARSPDPEARRLGAAAGKKLLAWRLAFGAGIAADPARARRMLEEICRDGDLDVCRQLEKEFPPSGAPEGPRRAPPTRAAPR